MAWLKAPAFVENGTGGTVTLTYAEPEERAAVAADADPVSLLKAAERDGLLRYHGFRAGGWYEVDVVGQRRELPRGEVAGVVARLRAVDEMAAPVGGALLREVLDDGTHVVQFEGGARVERLPADRVVDWCAGYVAARNGVGQQHVGGYIREVADGDSDDDRWAPCEPDEPGAVDRITLIAELFEQSGRDDQCRMVILGLMHGRPKRTSTEELAERTGKAKKTVVEALSFGNYLSSELAEQMIQAFGMRWLVGVAGAPAPASGGAPEIDLPEMPGLARLRRIVEAYRLGWLRYLDKPSPNQARWNRKYRLSVGSQTYEVTDVGLDTWLDGMRAFHAASQSG